MKLDPLIQIACVSLKCLVIDLNYDKKDLPHPVHGHLHHLHN